MIISSIVGKFYFNLVNLPSIKAKRAYSIIVIGDHKAKTSPAKSKSGELVFIEKYELEKNSLTAEGIV